MGTSSIVVGDIRLNGMEFGSDFDDVELVWDRLKVVDFLASDEEVNVGDIVTVWCELVYEYDSMVFSGPHGDVFINGEEMSWSSEDTRWEYSTVRDSEESVNFKVTKVVDDGYSLEFVDLDSQKVVVKWVKESVSKQDRDNETKGIPGFPIWSIIVALLIVIIGFRKNIVLGRAREPGTQDLAPTLFFTLP